MTPYLSGFSINSIPPVDPLDPDLPRQKQAYQSIVGCINWLATCFHPNIAPVITFIASYSNAPNPQHYKATVHALKDLTSTNEWGISFHSKSSSKIQAFDNFPHHHDKESYTEVTAPSPSECHQLTAFCDAKYKCQFFSTVKEGAPLELFKFRSL